MSSWITSAAVATLLIAVATSDVPAQTSSSPPATPRIQPDSFTTPSSTKNAPVKRAKSCDSYGDGFVNVPGTDTCVKINGYVRSEAGGRR